MEYIIDAKNKKLGRLASEVAIILQGKKSVYYNPRLAGADTVIVKNASQLDITPAKRLQKEYHRHTGYMGHLKTKRLEQIWEKSPEKVLHLAIARMLPKNFLRPKRLKRLTIER